MDVGQADLEYFRELLLPRGSEYYQAGHLLVANSQNWVQTPCKELALL